MNPGKNPLSRNQFELPILYIATSILLHVHVPGLEISSFSNCKIQLRSESW